MSQTQKQNNEQVEPIFEKKSINKYEAKAFKPSIADLVKQITKTVVVNAHEPIKEDVDELVTDDEKKDIAIGLEQLPHIEQQTELLNQADPRNNLKYFEAGYAKWARDNSETYTNLASVGSKISFWLGSTLVANPAEKGLPDYIWYLPKDRLTVFRGHFHPQRIMMNDKYILHTNRYILELRDKLQKRIAFWFLIFGLAFGGFTWSATKIHNGYVYVSNKIAAHGDKEKFKQQQLDSLKADAIALVEDYKAGKLTDSQFLEKKNELKAREADINKQ
jgi:hypothetical protein